jgi:ADP-ribose pyrophosphatase
MAEDDHLREHRLHSERVFEGNFLKVQRDKARLPSGHDTEREYIRHPGASVVVPILDDGRVVLERQFRYPLQRVMLEFPAGKIDPGEPPLHTAVRELTEETGYSADEWAYAGAIHNAAAYSDEVIHLYFARGLREGEASLDHGEHLDVVLMTEDELDALAARGELTDAKTLIGLLWLGKLRQKLWSLDWQPPPAVLSGKDNRAHEGA